MAYMRHEIMCLKWVTYQQPPDPVAQETESRPWQQIWYIRLFNANIGRLDI